MAQFGRPNADTYNADGWTEDDGTSVDMYLEIDEVVADDADFVRSALTPTLDVYTTRLSTVTDPLSSTGHIVRYRYGKDAASGDQIDLLIELRQGYVNEGSQGTLIATVATLTNIGVAWIAGTYTLSGAEADAITNYADLFVRIRANKV